MDGYTKTLSQQKLLPNTQKRQPTENQSYKNWNMTYVGA